MRKKTKPAEPVPQPQRKDVASNWATFFRDQRSPFLRSQLITALMAGRQLEVERLPPAALLDAVVIAMAARVYHEAEIVDDFDALLRRTDEVWKDPMWTRRIFDQVHMSAANAIIKGLAEFVCTEDLYIPELVGWYLAHDVPVYFEKEL